AQPPRRVETVRVIANGMALKTFFFSSRRRHTISKRDWSSDVCSSDLDSGYSVGHSFLLAGSGERAAATLTSLAGYRRSPRGRQRCPIIRSNTHAPDQTESQLQLLH